MGRGKQRPPGWPRGRVCPKRPTSPQANSLPNLIDDFLLLLDFISESGQLLLMSFPVALHLLLQRLLQPRPGEMYQPHVGSQPAL